MFRAVILALCWTTSTFAISSRPLQWVTDADQKVFEHYVRQTNTADLVDLIPRMVFYDSSRDRKFQLGDLSDGRSGVYSTPQRFFLDPNVFVPWLHPGGLSEESNASWFNFVVFPEPKGTARVTSEMIRYWRNGVTKTSKGTLVWEFPVGTVFGQVLLVRNESDQHQAFEVRTRTKHTAGLNKGWELDSFRPFPHQEDLLRRVQDLAEQEVYRGSKLVSDFISFLSNPRKMATRTISDGFKGKVFKPRTVFYDFLPELPEKMINELLVTTPFQRGCGAFWTDFGPNAPGMPTTKAAYHIVPRNTNLPIMIVDNDMCASCHDTTLKPASEFAQNINGRDWLGRVRGSDGILSFNPFGGEDGTERFRKDLVDAGLIVESTEK